jgi:hypothetical protein
MATRWGLIVEEAKGGRYGFVHNTVLEVFTGTREEALARLEGHATTFRPRQLRHPPRTRLFRSADGFLLVGSDLPSEYATDWHVLCRFSVAELVRDSEDTRREVEAEWRAREEQRARDRAEKKRQKRLGY